MKVGEKGKALLEEWEGLSTHVYLDSGGAPTIGIGHLLTRSERTSGKIDLGRLLVDYRDGLSEAECRDLLAQDLGPVETIVNEAVTVKLTQDQFDCLVSFAFNVGNAAFQSSTLLRLLNEGNYEAVPTQLVRWNRDNGHVVRGLTVRRAREVELWVTTESV